MPKDIAVEVDHEAIGDTPVRTHAEGRPVQGKDKTPTLIQNTVGSYKFVPRWLADEIVAKHEAVVLKKTDPEYMDAFRLAVGMFEGFKKGEVVQIAGKAVRAEEIGKADVEALIKAAEAEVEKLSDSKTGKIVVVKDLPTGAARFQERVRNRARTRGED